MDPTYRRYYCAGGMAYSSKSKQKINQSECWGSPTTHTSNSIDEITRSRMSYGLAACI